MNNFQALTELKKKVKNNKLIIKTSEGEFEETFIFNDGLTIIEQKILINEYNNLIPNEYLTFLKICNGCRIFDFDSLDGFNFFSVKNKNTETDILKINSDIANSYGELWNPNILLIAECIGEGNYIGIKLSEEEKGIIYDCFHEEIPENWKQISKSLDDFLTKLIEANGLKYWL